MNTGDYYNDGQIEGYFDESGKLIVESESGSDWQLGKYGIEVMNGNGYYDEDGSTVLTRDPMSSGQPA